MSLDHLVSVLLSLSSCASNLGFTFIALNHTVLNHFSLRLSPALQTLHCLLLTTSLFFCLFLVRILLQVGLLKTFISRSLLRAISNDIKECKE